MKLLIAVKVFFFSIQNIVLAILTKSILSIFYFLILLPYALLIRPFIGDILKQNVDPNINSYWINVAQINNRHLRQF